MESSAGLRVVLPKNMMKNKSGNNTADIIADNGHHEIDFLQVEPLKTYK